MLTITTKSVELYRDGVDGGPGVYTMSKPTTVVLEHSLISISKWEAIWAIPFISNAKSKPKTPEQIKSYIECMIIGRIDQLALDILLAHHTSEIEAHISAPMTATTVQHMRKAKGKSQVVTSELIYFWMINFNIPVEFERWHLNRLLKLIEVCNVQNNPGKKLSKREILQRNQALNAKRRAELGG